MAIINDQPLQLSNDLSLYSGDVIIPDNSSPLLVEVIDKQSIKLRRIDKNEYLYKSINLLKRTINPLRFSSDTKKFSVFAIAQSNDNKVSLKTDGKYLDFDKNEFSLSDKVKWLTITKQENVENIADFKEEVKITNLHQDQTKTIIDQRQTIAAKSHNNDTDNCLESTFELTKEIHKEHNLTWSKELTLGAKAKLSIAKSVGLNISGKYEQKSTTSNSITETEVETIKDSLKVNCAPWKETKVKLEVRKISLLTPYTAQVKRTIGNNTYNYLIEGELTTDNYSESRCRTETNTVRNILIVGWTGNGKSTLANVLADTNIFTESNQGVGQTKFFQKSNIFEWKGEYYRVIDNIGFGDTRGLDKKQLLLRVGEGINAAKEGLNQVLFVFSSRFSQEQLEAYKMLKVLIQESGINQYTTLVRTHFTSFENEAECHEDRFNLKNETREIKEIIDSCRDIIYVDNPSLPVIKEGDKGTARKRKLTRLSLNQHARNKSREIVLNYLTDNCNNQTYKLKEWDNIAQLVNNYLQAKEQVTNQKDLSELEKNASQQIEERIDFLSNFRNPFKYIF
jgi:predicted GTPase